MVIVAAILLSCVLLLCFYRCCACARVVLPSFRKAYDARDKTDEELSRRVRACIYARVAVAGANFLRPTFCFRFAKASSPFCFLAFTRTITILPL